MKAVPIVILVLLLAGCSEDSTQGPHLDSPPPEGFDKLIPLIDWELPALGDAAAALARADTSGAASLLLEHFEMNPPIAAPHLSWGDPVGVADELMAGILKLSSHPPATLPEDPTWAEDPFNDVNWRYQLHTFRWAMPLLAAYEVSGDRLYLDRFLFLLHDYVEDNLVPYPAADMVWYDMAASIRLEHWLYAWRQLLILDEIDEIFMSRFLHWLQVHGDMITDEVPYAEESNHGTFHNRSLLAAGIVLPELLDSGRWFNVGFDRNDEQILGMLSPQGVQLEQSPFYHFYVYSLTRSISNLLDQVGLSFSPALRDIIEGMPIFAAHIVRPNGYVPMLGDSPVDFEATRWLGRDPVLDFSLSQGAEGTHPGERFKSYPQTGYVLLRSGWGETRPFAEETLVTFDTGPRGGWHGHYDALTVTMSALGQDLLVDSGYYTLNSDSWRTFFLSPAAHNILLPIEDPDDIWDATPQRMIWRTGEDWAYQSALVDITAGCSWVRHAVYLDPGDLILLDQVFGHDTPRFECLFHFPPQAEWLLEEERIRLTVEDVHLDVFPALPGELEMIEGRMTPLQGWYSPKYGTKEPSPTASYRSEETGLQFVTLLHPHDGDDRLLDFTLVQEVPNESYTLRIERSSGVETVVVNTAIGFVGRNSD